MANVIKIFGFQNKTCFPPVFSTSIILRAGKSGIKPVPETVGEVTVL